MIGGNIIWNVLGGIIGYGVAAGIGNLLQLGGYLWLGFNTYKMAQELKAFTSDAELNPIFAWIPCLNIYFLVIQVPALMAKAKQMAGSQVPVRPVWLYFLLGLYAFAADLNDIAG